MTPYHIDERVPCCALQQIWPSMSAKGQKADVTLLNFNVRFTPENAIRMSALGQKLP
jgi:hypothetical protein